MNHLTLQELLIALEYFESSGNYDYDDPRMDVLQKAIELKCEEVYRSAANYVAPKNKISPVQQKRVNLKKEQI